MFISNCFFANNSAYLGGAIFIPSGNLSVSNSELTRNSAHFDTKNLFSGYGGSVYVHTGNLVISNSKLTNNKAFTGGGGVFVLDGIVYITTSNFTNTTAYYGGGISIWSRNVTISDCKFFNNNVTRYGGAMYIRTAYISIIRCIFHNNNSSYGGGAIYIQEHSALLRDLIITNCNAGIGGAIVVGKTSELSNIVIKGCISNRAVVYIHRGTTTFANVSFIGNNEINMEPTTGLLYTLESQITFLGKVTFVNNTNASSISLFDSTLHINGRLIFINNNANENDGVFAVVLSEVYFNSTEGVEFYNNSALNGGAIFLRDSSLNVYSNLTMLHNTPRNGGAIFAYQSSINFKCEQTCDIVIANNHASQDGGGIWVLGTNIQLLQSLVFIDSNSALANGGGIFLQESSKMYLLKHNIDPVESVLKVKLQITNNSAQFGGGIFVDDKTAGRGMCEGSFSNDSVDKIISNCFIQTINLHGRADLSLRKFSFTTFSDNIATESGAAIYGGMLDRCTASFLAELHGISDNIQYINSTVNVPSLSVISSAPLRVDFCNPQNVSVRKGEPFKVSVKAVDQVGKSLNATILSTVKTESGIGHLNDGQDEKYISNQCTDIEYNLFSPDDFAQIEIYADGPCSNLGISMKIFFIIFLPCDCPIGLQPSSSPIECKCICDVRLKSHGIKNCSNGTVLRPVNMWIGVRKVTENGVVFVISECLFDYCVKESSEISMETLKEKDKQCAYNRSGILCGQCEEGLSLVLATSKCKDCSNLYLLLLIPFSLTGIALVTLILLLNITVATGNLYGLIFYANILAANKPVFLPFNNFLTVFISWVNLDLGIESCFYDGMTAQAKVLLQLVFPAYLFLLMFLVIVLCKYSDSFSKLLSNANPVAALCTLFLLSYSKLLRFVISALQFNYLTSSDGSQTIVWSYDANVPYLTPGHIPQFVAAIVVLIASGLFTLLVFFGQWFPRCSNFKIMKWTRNTRYIAFMDAYHAPFTSMHRYWLGWLLFSLIGYNIATALATNKYLPVILAGSIANAVAILKLTTNGVYRNLFSNLLETLFLFNLSVLSYGTSYALDVGGNQYILANISMAIAFGIFFVIVFYHMHEYFLKRTAVWMNIMQTIADFKTRMINLNIPNLRRQPEEMEQLLNLAEGHDSDESDEELLNLNNERAMPDRPFRDENNQKDEPPTVIFAQLREPDLDILAPVSTGDYRSVPTTQVRNYPAAVTHTLVDITHH